MLIKNLNILIDYMGKTLLRNPVNIEIENVMMETLKHII